MGKEKKSIVFPLRLEQSLYDDIRMEAHKRKTDATTVMRERLKNNKPI
jgi:hypothetical protein